MRGYNVAVLMSIRPEWCALILDDRKVVEVRKSRPWFDPPFKVYVYCTEKGDKSGLRYLYGKDKANQICGKVCAEFICRDLTCIQVRTEDDGIHLGNTAFLRTCLTDRELVDYLLTRTDGKRAENAEGWGWHISNLKIYDEPKTIEEMGWMGWTGPLKRAPQSYRYVEAGEP